MVSVRWRPSSWMQFSSLFFLNRPWHWPTTDDRSDEFPDGWLPSNHSTYGVCECKHAISNTPRGKNHTLKDRESEGATACLRNRKWGARETCFQQWSLTRLQCALWHHLVESGQPRGKECRPPRSPPPRPNYWVLPIQTMSGSPGSPCIFLFSKIVRISFYIAAWAIENLNEGDFLSLIQSMTQI